MERDARVLLRNEDIFAGLSAVAFAAEYARRYEAIVETRLQPNGTWQDMFIQQGYLRGLRNAQIDLRRNGVTDRSDPEAVIASAVHLNALLAAQSQARTDLRNIGNVAALQVRESLQEALLQGVPLRDIEAAVIADRSRKIGLTRSRALATTVIVGLVADSVLNRLQEVGVQLVSPLVEYNFTTAGDDRVCPRCLALEAQDNGRGPGVYTIQEARGLIPVHVNCLTPDHHISAPDAKKGFARHYDGHVYEFKLPKGRSISCTPNHPILIDGVGFVAAKDITREQRMMVVDETAVSSPISSMRQWHGHTLISSVGGFHGDMQPESRYIEYIAPDEPETPSLRMQPCEILSIKKTNYKGTVYNVETESGQYVANGIVTHNCRCTWRVNILGLTLPITIGS